LDISRERILLPTTAFLYGEIKIKFFIKSWVVESRKMKKNTEFKSITLYRKYVFVKSKISDVIINAITKKKNKYSDK